MLTLLSPENPYTAAQRFLQNNDLPLSYLDEVVRFIEKNATGATIGSNANNQYVDPFTGQCGAQLYLGNKAHWLQALRDTRRLKLRQALALRISWTRSQVCALGAGLARTCGSYAICRCFSVPLSCACGFSFPSALNVDRWRPVDRSVKISEQRADACVTTADGGRATRERYSCRKSSEVSVVGTALTVSQRTPISFRQAHVTAMQAKLYQFDQALKAEIVSGTPEVAGDRVYPLITFPFRQSTSSLAMYPQELNLIEETFTYLTQVVSHPTEPPSKKLTSSHIDAIIQLLERWPQSQLFPRMFPT